MSINDPIADFLTRIKNAALAGREKVLTPYSRINESLAKILLKEDILEKVEVVKEGEIKNLNLTLSAKRVKSKSVEVKRISKPGRRVYSKVKKIRVLKRGLGIVILSTPQGIMTADEALKKNIGGEVIGKIT